MKDKFKLFHSLENKHRFFFEGLNVGFTTTANALCPTSASKSRLALLESAKAILVLIVVRVKPKHTTSTQLRLLTTLKSKPFENNKGKGENAGYQLFLLFPHCFLPIPKRISAFKLTVILSSADALNLDQSKNLSFGEVLYFRLVQTKNRKC